MTAKVFSADYFGELVQQAAASPRKRQHKNIHTDYADPCQRLFNAIEPDSYLRPHKHYLAQGAEMMIAVRGLMKLVLFDDDGQITYVITFGAGQHQMEAKVAAGVETAPGQWHTVIALESGSVLLEVKAGPFDPSVPKNLALWAPEEGSIEGVEYHRALIDSIKQ